MFIHFEEFTSPAILSNGKLNGYNIMKIETKHIVWIFDMAGENIQKEIERLEMELVRHKILANEPFETIRSIQKLGPKGLMKSITA